MGSACCCYQAVRGFQMWFGVRPEVTPELRALVETDLPEIGEYCASGRGFTGWTEFDFSNMRRHKPDASFQGGRRCRP